MRGERIFALYHKAYAMIGAHTPIPADCGELCGARCCGGEEECGMILFPGEEALISGEGWRISERIMLGRRVWFLNCGGKCSRHLRPLSCRIYPLAPHLDAGGLSVIVDPRARAVCPLAAHAEDQISKIFRASVLNAFSLLSEEDTIFEMLIDYSKMLDEYSGFFAGVSYYYSGI